MLRLILDILRAWRDSVDALLAVCVVAAAAWMLSHGLANWAQVLWVEDNGGSKSALPHAMRLDEWSDVLRSVGGTRNYAWFVVVRAGGHLEPCESLLSRMPMTTDNRPTAVLRLVRSTQAPSVMTCTLPPSGSGRRVDVISALQPVTPNHPPIGLEEGFALMDSSYKVVYGSINMNDARRIRSVEEFLLRQ